MALSPGTDRSPQDPGTQEASCEDNELTQSISTLCGSDYCEESAVFPHYDPDTESNGLLSLRPSDILGQGGIPGGAHSQLSTIEEGEPVFPREERDPLRSVSASELVGLDEEQSRDLKSELAEMKVTVCDLKEELESTKRLKSEKEQRLVEFTMQHEAEIASKNAEIEELKTEVDSYKLRLSNLEKVNSEEKEKYEAKIRSLEEKLREKEEECKREKLELKLEIADHKLTIADMRTQEERLYRKLAEANESAAKAEVAAAKAEVVAAKAEVEAARCRENAALAKLASSEENERMKDEFRQSFSDFKRWAEDEVMVSLTDRMNSMNSMNSFGSTADSTASSMSDAASLNMV